MSGDDPAGLTTPPVKPLVVGRYALYDAIAQGGMATVHLGRLVGEAGFTRTVAIKRLHPQYAQNHEFSTMFRDEARVAARVRHPNVVATLDVVTLDSELLIVMEYTEGASLAKLMRTASEGSKQVPMPMLSAVMSGVLQGLHAAHEATDEQGNALEIVHRDVSPQNVIVGADGGARVLDFGIAKAVGQAHLTMEGQVKGKLAYMAPEQLQGIPADRTVDIFAAGTVMWELATGHRLFYGTTEGEVVHRIMDLEIPLPSTLNAAVPPALDAVIMRALERDRTRRFPTAAEMATALELAVTPATALQIGEWVVGTEPEMLRLRRKQVAHVEAQAPHETPAHLAAAYTSSGSHANPFVVPVEPVIRGKSRYLGLVFAALAVSLGAWALVHILAPARPPVATAAPPPPTLATTQPEPVASSPPESSAAPQPSASAAPTVAVSSASAKHPRSKPPPLVQKPAKGSIYSRD